MDTHTPVQSAAWDALARYYHSDAGKLTAKAVDPLLEAIAVGPATMLLDLATGPGYGAGAAQARGAIATGIDFSPEMIKEANRNFADALFYEGDAQSLVFARDFFDAVISAFGLPYIESPQRVIGEAFRVLRPGGKIAYTVWATLSEPEFLQDVMEITAGIVAETGHLEEAKHPAAANIRALPLTEGTENERLLKAEGFENIAISTLQLKWEPRNSREARDACLGGLIPPQALAPLKQSTFERISKAVLELADQAPAPLPCTALLVRAQKPK